MNYDSLYDLNCNYSLQKKDIPLLLSYFKSKKGWIYIAKSKDNPFLKIGRTAKDPFSRAKSLSSTGVFNEYEIVFSLKFFNHIWAEKLVHQNLKKFRVNKEFFSLKEETAFDVFQKTKILEETLLNRFIKTEIIEEDLNLLEYSLKN